MCNRFDDFKQPPPTKKINVFHPAPNPPAGKKPEGCLLFQQLFMHLPLLIFHGQRTGLGKKQSSKIQGLEWVGLKNHVFFFAAHEKKWTNKEQKNTKDFLESTISRPFSDTCSNRNYTLHFRSEHPSSGS